MKGCVAIGCGSIRMGHMLQQQLHNLSLSQSGCNVEWSLVLLRGNTALSRVGMKPEVSHYSFV